MRPKAPRVVRDKCGRQVWETSVGDKCGRQEWETSVGDKWETSVNSCGPSAPRVGDKCKIMRPRHPGGDKCKLMWPKEPEVADKCGRQVGDKCKIMRPKVGPTSVGDKWETSVNSCAPRHPAWETSVGRQVWETSVKSCGRKTPSGSVGDKWETSVNSCGPRHPE